MHVLKSQTKAKSVSWDSPFRLEEAEDVDVNAGIHGNWTMENAKSMLHQFIQMRHIKTDYKYAMQGTSFVAEMSFYVKVRWCGYGQGFVDPHWFNADADPAFFLIANPVPDPGFPWPKIEQIYSWIFFGSRIAIYLSIGLPKGRPTKGKAFNPLKRTSRHFKTWKFFSIFVCHFCNPVIENADPDPATQINADPDAGGDP